MSFFSKLVQYKLSGGVGNGEVKKKKTSRVYIHVNC